MKQELLDRLVQAAQDVSHYAERLGGAGDRYVVDEDTYDNLVDVVKEISDDAYATITRYMQRAQERKRLGIGDDQVMAILYADDDRFVSTLAAAWWRGSVDQQRQLQEAFAEVWDQAEDRAVELRKMELLSLESAGDFYDAFDHGGESGD